MPPMTGIMTGIQDRLPLDDAAAQALPDRNHFDTILDPTNGTAAFSQALLKLVGGVDFAGKTAGRDVKEKTALQ